MSLRITRVRNNHNEPYELLEAHIDPKHNDIVLSGFGITKRQTKQISNWFIKAVAQLERKRRANEPIKPKRHD